MNENFKKKHGIGKYNMTALKTAWLTMLCWYGIILPTDAVKNNLSLRGYATKAPV